MSAELDLSGYHRAVAQTKRELELGVRRSVGLAAVEGAQYARSVAPFKDHTGQLRSGIVSRFLRSDPNGATWEIVSPTGYSRFVESGTRAHDIYPKAGYRFKGPVRDGQTRRATGNGPHEHIVGRGQALRWVSGGVTHFAAMVHHPGSRAYPFMGPAYIKSQAVLQRELEVTQFTISKLWE